MISFPDSKMTMSFERPVQTGQTVTEEGQVLVSTLVSGVFGVQPSTGTASEIFAGVSLAHQLTLLYLPWFDVFTVPSTTTGSNSVTLTNTPATINSAQATSMYGYDVTQAKALTSGTVSTSTYNWSITGTTFSFFASSAGTSNIAWGDTIYISYRYSPTTVQATAMQGMIPAGGGPALVLGTVGVITQGDIFTSEYDTSVIWSTATTFKTGLSATSPGVFTTTGGSGSTVTGYILQAPSYVVSTTTPNSLGFGNNQTFTNYFLGVHFII